MLLISIFFYLLEEILFLGIGDWGLGIWGLGIGGWAQPPNPNPQSPIPNPQKIAIKLNKIFKLNQSLIILNYFLYIYKSKLNQYKLLKYFKRQLSFHYY